MGFGFNMIVPLLPPYCDFFVLGHGTFIWWVSNILLSMVVQQLAAALMFSQEKMSSHSFCSVGHLESVWGYAWEVVIKGRTS